MLNQILTKVFGSSNERQMKKLQPIVAAIGELEPAMQALDDAQMRAKKGEFRERLERGEALDDLLPEAFALVREAGVRVLGMRHYDVQLIGGIILNEGKIAEMKTGEGKTLVSTLAAYLNALTGNGVHIVTVNDYLARRDAEWMGQLHEFLGMSVGVIQNDMDDAARQHAYRCDITYATNNELGFDYLRDNMKFTLESMVQRPLHFAIVDEVDSILIDEARTPLIISGPADAATDHYGRINTIIPRLTKGAVTQGGKDYEVEHTGDYVVDEKARTVTLTDDGVEKCQRMLGVENLYDQGNIELVHHVNQALKAHVLFKRDVDYMVKEGQVMIVDEFTGRLMPGRRWSDGLHQAVEAKEGVTIERENQTLATITFQNFFRMYDKLSGMTGTADTESVEFDNIYKLEVSVIPTNRPLIRKENADVIFRTEPEKWRAVVEDLLDCQERGQPSLVGTVSIENSEKLAALLKRRGVKHVVLNAKFHDREAEIVAQAGRAGAVTIATNMAGRGTDILLGGNPEFLARRQVAGDAPPGTVVEPDGPEYEAALAVTREQCQAERERVLEAGGLYIVGTERHESRRIDNQLRGRAGRQGDPGESRFYLSLDDDLMRIFAGERLKSAMTKLGMEEDVPIESPMVSRAIERAQKQVEARNFETRKHLLEYDDVNNKQRTEIYALRRDLLAGKEQREYLMERAGELLELLVEEYLTAHTDPAERQVEPFAQQVRHFFGLELAELGAERDGASADDPFGWLRGLGSETTVDAVWPAIEARYAAKEAKVGDELMRQYERHILLQIIDGAWKDHLLAMDHLKDGIGLRAYGQKDPLAEYKRESFEMFGEMKRRIEQDAVRFLFLLEPMTEQEREREEQRRRAEQEQIFRAASRSAAKDAAPAVTTVKRDAGKVGRNDPCPCGSGKKFKKCHGAGGAG